MTKGEFISEVEKIHLVEDCSISDAIDIARKRNEVTDSEFILWFRKSEKVMQNINKE